MEKLEIRLGYDKKNGISIEDFIKQLDGINKDYSRFVGNHSEIHIEKITEGCISIYFVEYIVLPVMPGIVLTSLYDYGKHVILSLNLGSDKKTLKQETINEKTEMNNQAHTAKNITNVYGDNNRVITIDTLKINVVSSDPDKQELNYSNSSEGLKKNIKM